MYYTASVDSTPDIAGSAMVDKSQSTNSPPGHSRLRFGGLIPHPTP